jgi:putative transposase
LIEPAHPHVRFIRQCELLGIARSGWYYEQRGEMPKNLALMRLLDEQYTRTPIYSVERMTAWLRQQVHPINPKRVRRLLRLMGLEALYPRPRLSAPGDPERRYPYLLRGRTITEVNEVWSTDIAYVRMPHGFLYLVAVLDWYSRYFLAWELSNTLDTPFCLAAPDMPCGRGGPASSTPTKAPSSPAPSTPIGWSGRAFRSTGMGVDGRSIMSSSSASGVRLSRRKSICTTTKRSPTR